MLTIRRMVSGRQSYTVLMLPPHEPKIIPTTEHEHAEILRIYKQDRRARDVSNDFTHFDLT